MLSFASDYLEGTHPAILDALVRTNLEQTSGYGTDSHTAEAVRLIREACAAPEADVRLLVGGTQANAVVIGACLRPWQGVLAAETGHINGHEAGAIEHGGHKVLALPQQDGKITAQAIRAAAGAYRQDGNRDHIVEPAMVYLSQPTEYGTLYSLNELEAIRKACDEGGLLLYVDGARLAYALASPANDVTLPDLARLCDVFYIGGTKCGALFGEAVVVPDPGLIPGFFPIIKQNGALLAKGRVAGIQFEELFRGGLYLRIGESAVRFADQIRQALEEKGYEQTLTAPTNQIFVRLEDEKLRQLNEQVETSFWEKTDAGHTVIRIATSWATTQENVDRLIALL